MEMQARILCRSENARPPVFGETEAASHLPLPLVRPWLSPLWRRARSDLGPKFVQVCFSSVTTCGVFPSGREAARGALTGVLGDLGSSSYSVTNAQDDLGGTGLASPSGFQYAADWYLCLLHRDSGAGLCLVLPSGPR